MRRHITALTVALLLALSASALQAAPVILLNSSTGLPDGDPIVIRHTGGYNSTHPSGLTMNRATGTLYFGSSYNGGREVHKFDSSVTKFKSAANATGNDAGMGEIRHYTSHYFEGSVASGTAKSTGYSVNFPSWNPTSGTLMLKIETNSYYWAVDELLPQTSSEGVGVLNEGQAKAFGSNQVLDGAIVSRSTQSLAVGHVAGGLAWADHVNIGGTDYDRAFYGFQKSGTNDPARVVRVIQMTDTINGLNATTVGSRTTLEFHNNSEADATLLDDTAYGALVDVASDEWIADLAVYDNTLYILSYSPTNGDTYVSALSYSVPTDGSTAVSYTVVDLDPNSAANYLVLDNLFDSPFDILNGNGGGIEFGAASGDTLMYVAATDGLTYTFNVYNVPVPEPATLALLGLGGLAMTGSALRRRRTR